MNRIVAYTFLTLSILFLSPPLWANASPMQRLQLQPNSPFAELLILEIYAQFGQMDADTVKNELEAALQLKSLPTTAASRARYLLAELRLRTGHPQEAQQDAEQLGYITQWQFVGPFSNATNNGLSTVYNLENHEQPIKELPRCDGSQPETSCSFSSGLLSRRLGETVLEQLFQPNQNICVYAQTTLEVANATKQTLFFGAAGQSKLFLNGEAIFEDRNEYNYNADINRFPIPVQLHDGSNMLTVKNCSGQNGKLSFYARLENKDGSSVAVQYHAGSFRIPFTTHDSSQRTHFAAASPLEQLKRVGTKKNAPSHQRGHYATYAMFTGAVGDAPMPRDAADQACRETAAFDMCHLWAALSEDINPKRFAYETVLARTPSDPDAQIALIDLDRDQIGKMNIDGRLSKFLNAHPNHVQGRCTQLKWIAQQLPRLAMRKQEQFLKDVSAPAAAICVAETVVDQAAHLRTLTYLSHAKSLDFSNLDWHVRELPFLAATSLKKARVEFSRMQQVGAPTVEQMLSAAASMKNVHDDKEHLSLFSDLVKQAPHVWQYQKELGLAYLEAGNTEKGIEFLTQASLLAPEVNELRELLAYIAPTSAFFEPYVVLPETFLAMAECKNGHDACQLVQNNVFQVHPNNTQSHFEQVVVRIKNRSGARQWQQYSAQFSSHQRVELVAARIFKTNGSIEEATGRATFPVSEPWYRLYYDVEAEVVELPKPQPGDVVEYQFRVDDVTNNNWQEGYFGAILPLQSDIPIQSWQAVVIHPRSQTLHMDIPKQVAHKSVLARQNSIEIFNATGLRRIPDEPLVDGATSLVDHVYLSTYKHWTEMRQWYREIVRPQFVTNTELKALVKRITQNTTDERSKIAAVYNWVTNHIRYVGLEFGIHGYKPYTTTQILARGFGDCKDTASLIVTMLSLLNIDANVALVRTRSAGKIHTKVPSMAAFNHAIAYVPKYDLWLDGTASHHGSSEFPFEDQGVAALLIHDKDEGLIQTPVRAPEHSIYDETRQVILNADGTATVSSNITVSGVFAPWFRSQFEISDAQTKLEKELSSHWTGIALSATNFSELSLLEEPPSVSYTATIPMYGRRINDHMRISPLAPLNLKQKFGSIRSRRHNLLLGPKKITRTQTRITLPDGYHFLKIPKSKQVESAFGALSLQFEHKSNQLIVTQSFHFKKIVVSPKEYSQFIQFCIEVDNAMKFGITATRKAGSNQ